MLNRPVLASAVQMGLQQEEISKKVLVLIVLVNVREAIVLNIKGGILRQNVLNRESFRVEGDQLIDARRG